MTIAPVIDIIINNGDNGDYEDLITPVTPPKGRERDRSVTVDTPRKILRRSEVYMEITPVHEPGTSLQDFDEITPIYAPGPEPEREKVDYVTHVYSVQDVNEITKEFDLAPAHEREDVDNIRPVDRPGSTEDEVDVEISPVIIHAPGK